MTSQSNFDPNINPEDVKKRSEKFILANGGEILEWLPTIDFKKIKTIDEIVERALIINAMFQLYMGAPKYIVANWFDEHLMEASLSAYEEEILCSEELLTEDEKSYLYWSLESLWAIAWATNLIHDLPFDKEAGDELASLSPNLQINEGGQKYENRMFLRPYSELYSMLDLYYRLHWWLNDWWQHNGESENVSIPHISLPVIIQRRAALEWILDRDAQWDNVDLNL